MVKRIFKYVLYGIAWGWCWLVLTCLIIDFTGEKTMLEATFNNFTKNVLASAITGMGFGTSAIVYTFEHLHRRLQILIHFGVGIGIYLPVAFIIGWLPSKSVVLIVSSIMFSILVFFIIWICFYLYHKADAKKINARLKAQELKNENSKKN